MLVTFQQTVQLKSLAATSRSKRNNQEVKMLYMWLAQMILIKTLNELDKLEILLTMHWEVFTSVIRIQKARM